MTIRIIIILSIDGISGIDFASIFFSQGCSRESSNSIYYNSLTLNILQLLHIE